MTVATSAAEVRKTIADLTSDAWIASAVAAAIEVDLPRYLRGPCHPKRLAAETGLSTPLVTRLAEALVAVGLARREEESFVAGPGLVDAWAGGACGFVRAELRSSLLQTAAFVEAAIAGRLTAGWAHTDEHVLQAQGTWSASSIEMVDQLLLPMLDGLLERLDSGQGALLDAGTGVAAVTIAFCQRHPRLRAVSLEPQSAPLKLARRNVEAAGLGERIELRQQLVEDLQDVCAFDLAWLAGDFLAQPILPAALDAVHRALRPGGWLITACGGGGDDSRHATAARLRAVLWGGDTVEPEHIGELLEQHGFHNVLVLQRRSSDLVPIVARRP